MVAELGRRLSIEVRKQENLNKAEKRNFRKEELPRRIIDNLRLNIEYLRELE